MFMKPHLPSNTLRTQKHERGIPLSFKIILTTGAVVEAALVVAIVWILKTQGFSQGLVTLSVIAAIIAILGGVPALILAYFQWHHPKSSGENISHSQIQQPKAKLDVQHQPSFTYPNHNPGFASPSSPVAANSVPMGDSMKETWSMPKDDASLYPSTSNITKFEEDGSKPVRDNVSARTSFIREDKIEAPYIEQFCGRHEEFAKLEQWVIGDHCRLVTVLGIGGIGKTTLTAKFAEQAKNEFEYVLWSSLQNSPPVQDVLRKWIQFLSNQKRVDLPDNLGERIELLITCLQQHHCLLILDNLESVLQGGYRVGQYRAGYEGFGHLIEMIGESQHNSCLLLTSREKPKEIAHLEGETLLVRSLNLSGLKSQEGQEILKDKGIFGSDEEWGALVDLYSGNPLALKLVSEPIRGLFDGNIAQFLAEKEAVVWDIHNLLSQQFERLSQKEQEIMYWLAIEREAVSFDVVWEDMMRSVPKAVVLEDMGSLRRRSMVQTKGAARFTLQPVIMEYVTERFVEAIYEEINKDTPILLERHALIKAQSKDYVRESQIRLILETLGERLLSNLGKEKSEMKLKHLLSSMRETLPHSQGYVAGNVFNLIIQLKCDPYGYDFSQLVVRQAYMQGTYASGINFAYADLETCIFTDTFGSIFSVSFSSDGSLLTAGTANGEIRLWNALSGTPLRSYRGSKDWIRSVTFSPDTEIIVGGGDDSIVRFWDRKSGQCLKTLRGHLGWVYSIAVSPDGSTVASAAEDQVVRLWDIKSGQCLKVLEGHTERVWSVAFNHNGTILASGSDDQTVRLWDVRSGECFKVLLGHTSWVRSVAFDYRGVFIITGGEDKTVRLWEVESGKCLKVLQGHTNRVYSVAFSNNGRMIASGSEDQMVRLWDVKSGECLKVLQGHTGWVRSVAFSPDDMVLASGSEDATLLLWEVESGHCLKTLKGYTDWVRSVDFSPDGKMLTSSSEGQTVYLWDLSSGRCFKTLREYTSRVYAAVFSPSGEIIASGNEDQTIRLWDVESGQCIRTLQGHTSRVRSVAFSPDGQTIASGSQDNTVRLWDVGSGECLRTTLLVPSSWVRHVAFSIDGKMLVSGNEDYTVRIWDVKSGECLKVLLGHTKRVRSVAFSPDGKTIVSGSEDYTVRLWDVKSGECLKVLLGHTNWVRAIAINSDGGVVASAGEDQTVRLWDVKSGECLKVIKEHSDRVNSVDFGPSNDVFASCSNDGMIKIWEVQTGKCLQTLRSDRPYEYMNITGVKGLTTAQKAMLRALGAIDDELQDSSL